MIHRYTVLLFFSILVSCPVYGQFGIGGTKAIKQLKKSKLYVVLGYDKAYNEAIREAMDTYWTFNEFEYIRGSEYKKYCSDPRNAFLLQFIIKDWAFVEEKYEDIGIVLGGNCRVGPYDMVSYANMIVMADPYYKAECVRAVQFMQNYLNQGMEYSLRPENYTATCKLYNQNHQELGSKTLVLQDEDLLEGYNTLDRIRDLYHHKVRFGRQSEVDKATLEQDEDFVYTKLIYDVNGYKYRCVIQAKDSKILFALETQNKEVILMGKRTLKAMSDLNNQGHFGGLFNGF